MAIGKILIGKGKLLAFLASVIAMSCQGVLTMHIFADRSVAWVVCSVLGIVATAILTAAPSLLGNGKPNVEMQALKAENERMRRLLAGG